MQDKCYNPYIEFYDENKISPVSQDISDFKKHMLRREQLYRYLGLPAIAFTDKKVMEIGPGGGYNSLCLLEWGARVDLIEPNPTAQTELEAMFSASQIDHGRWTLHKMRIEDYVPDGLFDIVIAEGFLPGVINQQEVIDKIVDLVKKGGVAVVTCLDEISRFFDSILRRAIGLYLIQRQYAVSFADKVDLLSRAFAKHLASLKYSSRPIRDWAADNLLNPDIYSEQMSIEECLSYFGDDFEVLGTSPDFFSNTNWYKNIDYNGRESIIEQFRCKRHLLMMSGMEESVNVPAANRKLLDKCREMKQLVKRWEDDPAGMVLPEAIGILEDIIANTGNIDKRVNQAIVEAIALFRDPDIDENKVAQAGGLGSAFGKTMYVSLTRRFSD
ncbi:MAG: class I SAM-dependent methyltransferase [Deltaproteobacteria bacterium]